MDIIKKVNELPIFDTRTNFYGLYEQVWSNGKLVIFKIIDFWGDGITSNKIWDTAKDNIEIINEKTILIKIKR